MDNEYFVELSSFSCDSCGSKEGPTATYHCRGVPVLSQCQRCDPRQWMSGETPAGCGISY
ncbi:MAG: hypothetical protein EBT68_04520 [Verrucomicrobia bacterium]|nr:hypothetical protein [Verrucomicrobiota bacterium]